MILIINFGSRFIHLLSLPMCHIFSSIEHFVSACMRYNVTYSCSSFALSISYSLFRSPSPPPLSLSRSPLSLSLSLSRSPPLCLSLFLFRVFPSSLNAFVLTHKHTCFELQLIGFLGIGTTMMFNTHVNIISHNFR